MSKTWYFTYYGWFGAGDSSDDMDYETEVSDEEYSVLEIIDAYQNDDLEKIGSDFDYEEFIEKNQRIIDAIEERVQSEVEEYDFEEAGYFEGDDEEENLQPTIVVRWPWE